KILKENEIQPADVQGSGRDGRITKEDAAKAAEAKQKAPAEKPAPKKEAPAPKARVTGERSEERKKMSRMRRTIAKRLVSAKNDTAMLTTFNEADMTNIMELR
ncbi:E3 binding domain-containing protein, partial [Arthrospira platensis SPKY1]|nr:E3 binding domain-containing protein [Arthrospira platensis SPKY1]